MKFAACLLLSAGEGISNFCEMRWDGWSKMFPPYQSRGETLGATGIRIHLSPEIKSKHCDAAGGIYLFIQSRRWKSDIAHILVRIGRRRAFRPGTFFLYWFPPFKIIHAPAYGNDDKTYAPHFAREMYNRISILPELAEYQAAHKFLCVRERSPPSKYSNQKNIPFIIYWVTPVAFFIFYEWTAQKIGSAQRQKYQSWKTNLL